MLMWHCQSVRPSVRLNNSCSPSYTVRATTTETPSKPNVYSTILWGKSIVWHQPMGFTVYWVTARTKRLERRGCAYTFHPQISWKRSADSRFNTLAIYVLPVTTSEFLFTMAKQPLVGGAPPHYLGFTITLGDTPHSVGLLWTSDQPEAEKHRRQTTMSPAGRRL
jgi:hypothetical protein